MINTIFFFKSSVKKILGIMATAVPIDIVFNLYINIDDLNENALSNYIIAYFVRHASNNVLLSKIHVPI